MNNDLIKKEIEHGTLIGALKEFRKQSPSENIEWVKKNPFLATRLIWQIVGYLDKRL